MSGQSLAAFAAAPPAQSDVVGQAKSGTVVARRMLLRGGVQGLGVRPAIVRLARRHGLAGTVSNTPRGVEIQAEGPQHAVDEFERSLPLAVPHAAELVRLESASIAPAGHDDFTILRESDDGVLSTRIPRDQAVCTMCLYETNRSIDRRYGYVFTSCTDCGPRYTIIGTMPFERSETAMDAFPMCSDCRREYESPSDRRFHAQTIACPACGPQVWCCDSNGAGRVLGNQAVQHVTQQLLAGRIVALRGLGGYQLLVDATNQAAVKRLRERKGRRAKPLAVMVESTAVAQRLAFMNDAEVAAFDDSAGPIVLVRGRVGNVLAAAVHPQLEAVGLMRPTTPLHALIAKKVGRPLVCTSGNREGDPLEFEIAAAEHRLNGLCDMWLHNDRPIVRPIDDSVVRIIAGRRVTIRLARGLAPLPLELPPMPPTIAVGGYLKEAAAWSNGSQSVLGPHIGDQESLPARERFLAHLADAEQLYRFRAERLVHDLHPEYFSTQWAQAQPSDTLAVQHHHAHVVAGMLELGWLDRQVLGVAWDGTGYGTDGSIWGGEFLLASAKSFKRVGRLRPFRLPGGEAAIHRPWQTAVSIYAQLGECVPLEIMAQWGTTAAELATINEITDCPKLSPLTSSAGRLFDAAAAIILGIGRADFDGQAAMRLEACADQTAEGEYEFPISGSSWPELDWRPLFYDLLADHRRGVEPAVMAMRLHRGLACGIVELCRRWRSLPVVFSGGVFQNRLLTELIVELHADHSQQLGLPGAIPPNDGGLAAGQLAIAAARGGLIACA